MLATAAPALGQAPGCNFETVAYQQAQQLQANRQAEFRTARTNLVNHLTSVYDAERAYRNAFIALIGSTGQARITNAQIVADRQTTLTNLNGQTQGHFTETLNRQNVWDNYSRNAARALIVLRRCQGRL
ncbi:MAG: hypothetical protein Q7R41_17560 [Phycisphaerales bacterium]|nr:hypothetical protein [Phycisphaerales bacterium]